MYPKNKSQLLKWFKENIGAKMSLQRGVRYYEMDGKTLIEDATSKPLLRIVNKAQSNAVNFMGEEIDNEGKIIERTDKRPTWMYFDNKENVFTFDEFGFINASPKYEVTVTTKEDGKEKQVIKESYLKYSWNVSA